MTSIPLLVETIESKQFRCIYLKNKRFELFEKFKGALITIESVLRPVYHGACRGVISNETF